MPGHLPSAPRGQHVSGMVPNRISDGNRGGTNGKGYHATSQTTE